MANYGFGALQQSLLTPNNLTKYDLNSNTKIGRVVEVLLNPTSSSEVGFVKYVDVTATPNDVSSLNNSKKYLTAQPMDSNNLRIPLVNELIIIYQGPNMDSRSSIGSTTSYYIDILNIYNHPHHNALPQFQGNLTSTQVKSIKQIELGSSIKTPNQSSTITLGKTFIEREKINPLLPFEGDIIYQGRWGNSIRFGSTIPNSNFNDWSETGNSGDPITIIRNGQGEITDNGSQPITENINTDKSSIYLTSTQQVPIVVGSSNYYSYPKNNTPTNPNKYSGDQIIINSGRLVFNSSTNHLLLSSAKSISLSSVESVNVDTNIFTIQSNKLYLGSKSATEPLMLGNSTVDLLRQLIKGLKGFTDILSIQTNMPSAGSVPLEPMATNSKLLSKLLNDLDNNLDTITSKDNFTS